MTPAARHRRKLLHWLTIVSLMLALVLQPTLAAIGELHELGHDLDQTHIATEDHGAVTDEIAEHGESGDGTAGFLHLVHHITLGVPQVEPRRGTNWSRHWTPQLKNLRRLVGQLCHCRQHMTFSRHNCSRGKINMGHNGLESVHGIAKNLPELFFQ